VEVSSSIQGNDVAHANSDSAATIKEIYGLGAAAGRLRKRALHLHGPALAAIEINCLFSRYGHPLVLAGVLSELAEACAAAIKEIKAKPPPLKARRNGTALTRKSG
jgi:hypothetical protein